MIIVLTLKIIFNSTAIVPSIFALDARTIDANEEVKYKNLLQMGVLVK